MSERNPVRDRTLILRVLVPSLETRLRDKMKEAESLAASSAGSSGAAGSSSSMFHSSSGADNNNYLAKESLWDLDGVTCEPVDDGSTKWKFHCDGASYPARLVNLPCPVELHKTHDHAMYYKCCNVAQLLLVYEDKMAMEESESASGYKTEEYPSYYHSGITPPMKKVVERRFCKREHKAVPPPRTEVTEIELELKGLIDRISDSNKGKGKKNSQQQQQQQANKIIEEVVEDIVPYEPWMDDYGRTPNGIEFDSDDPRCTKHPELWLEPQEIKDICQVEIEKEEKKAAAAAKRNEKKAKKKKQQAQQQSGPKKNVNAKSNMAEIDEVTQAAAAWSKTSHLDILDDFDLGVDDNNFDFDDDALVDLGEFDNI